MWTAVWFFFWDAWTGTSSSGLGGSRDGVDVGPAAAVGRRAVIIEGHR